MKILPWICFLLVSAAANLANAQEGVDAEDYTPKTERRGGFMLGFAPAYGIGTTSGYPNEAEKVNRAEFRADTDLAAASYTSVWFGGALRDWFSYGLGGVLVGQKGNQLEASGVAFGVRLEAFPLYQLGGSLRDLGVHGEFGAGALKVEEKDGTKVADGGSLSLIGVGAFYEPWRLWQIKLGPSLEYSQMFSQTVRAHFVSLGLRTSFYGTLVD
ncbi:MAG: hypothetical protein SFV15_22855 [Polyangiaceae bacterium]|nr:hypothetical protein [Polyangiaceae bacterium]